MWRRDDQFGSRLVFVGAVTVWHMDNYAVKQQMNPIIYLGTLPITRDVLVYMRCDENGSASLTKRSLSKCD